MINTALRALNLNTANKSVGRLITTVYSNNWAIFAQQVWQPSVADEYIQNRWYRWELWMIQGVDSLPSSTLHVSVCTNGSYASCD